MWIYPAKMFIPIKATVDKPVKKECILKHKNIWKPVNWNATLCMQSEERESFNKMISNRKAKASG